MELASPCPPSFCFHQHGRSCRTHILSVSYSSVQEARPLRPFISRTVHVTGLPIFKEKAKREYRQVTSIKLVKQPYAYTFRNGTGSMYEMCSSVDNARLVFDKIYESDVFSWNVRIRGYARNGQYEEAIVHYVKMLCAGIQPNNFTFPFVLKACAAFSAMEEGEEIHNHVIKMGLESDVYVGTALINMYAKCGNMEDARTVFDKMSHRNVVLWTALIAGYAQNREAIKALNVFNRMQMKDIKPDPVTIVSVVLACAHLKVLQMGEMIHGYIIRRGFESHVYVATGIIAMYAKCRSVRVARRVFDIMPNRSVASWNAMVTGYAQNGHANKALALFRQMQRVGMKPDSITMLCVLPECAHLAHLQSGEQIHGYIIKSGFESDAFVVNSLIDMYAKSRRIDIARCVFDKICRRDLVSWNAMITGYAIQGLVEDVFSVFSQMQQAGMKPNDITFVSVLSACSHAGLLDKGWQYFDCMTKAYLIIPKVEHYACMVDLLGRTGHLVEARDFIKRMPLEPSASVWGTLFDACRFRGNIEIGQHVAEHLFELEPENAKCSVLLSNIYARAGRWEDLAKVITMIERYSKIK